MTAVASALPIKLIEVRAISMMASTPRITATASSGRLNIASAPERITSDARGTAATPFDVSISVSIIRICWPSVISMPPAWAANTDAMAR